MKNLSKLSIILCFSCICLFASCSSDDNDADQTADLVGVWQRSDFGETNAEGEMHDYRLYFMSTGKSYGTHGISYTDGTAISASFGFDTSISNDQLTLIFDATSEVITTPISFNTDGQLILTGITNLPFNEIEDDSTF